MKLNEFDVFRRYVLEGCARHKADCREAKMLDHDASFFIEDRYTGNPSDDKAIKVAKYTQREMARRGWSVEAFAHESNVSVRFKPDPRFMACPNPYPVLVEKNEK